MLKSSWRRDMKIKNCTSLQKEFSFLPIINFIFPQSLYFAIVYSRKIVSKQLLFLTSEKKLLKITSEEKYCYSARHWPIPSPKASPEDLFVIIVVIYLSVVTDR